MIRSRVTVEVARRKDAAAMYALHAAVLDEGRFFITTPDEYRLATPSQKELLIGELRRSSRSQVLVARDGRDLLGFLTIRGGMLRRMHHVGKLEIMVASAARGRGVGTALMTHAVQWATDNPELTKLGLNVFDDNAPAIALYERFGFVEEGRRPAEYLMEDGTYRGDVLMYRFV